MKASLVIEIVEPLVINSPMPRSEVRVASVMMNGGRPMRTMPKAWKAPISTPKASVRMIAIQSGTPAASSQATMTLVKPTTAPTERSMPAVMMTKVWPTARIAVIAPWRNRLLMLFGVQKLLVAKPQEQPEEKQEPEKRQAEQDAHAFPRRGAGSAVDRISTHRRPPASS